MGWEFVGMLIKFCCTIFMGGLFIGEAVHAFKKQYYYRFGFFTIGAIIETLVIAKFYF